MIEVYLLECIYAGTTSEEILLHLPNTDIWLGDEGYREERIVNLSFTKLFWEKVEEQQEDYLVYIGEL